MARLLPQLWGMAKKKGKSLGPIAWGALLLLGGVWLFRQTRRLDIGAATPSLLRLESGGIRINVKIPILNRSDFSATVQGFLGQLLYGSNNPIGTLTLTRQTAIPARGTAEPEFSVLVPYGSVAMEVYDILSAGASGGAQLVRWNDFRVRGTLYVSDLAIDIDEPIFA